MAAFQPLLAGFLRAREMAGLTVVTLAECQRYLREEADDQAAVRTRRQQR